MKQISTEAQSFGNPVLYSRSIETFQTEDDYTPAIIELIKEYTRNGQNLPVTSQKGKKAQSIKRSQTQKPRLRSDSFEARIKEEKRDKSNNQWSSQLSGNKPQKAKIEENKEETKEQNKSFFGFAEILNYKY